MKKLKKNKKLKNKSPWERLSKIQIYDKKEKVIKSLDNKNWIFYYFLIIMFSFSLFFILLKREEVI
jgi:hypothetical protein